MVDSAHTLAPDENRFPVLPAAGGQQTTIAVQPVSGYAYASVDLINLSLTEPIYYRRGDTCPLDDRAAQILLPGNRNTETVDGTGTHFTLVAANDVTFTAARSL